MRQAWLISGIMALMLAGCAGATAEQEPVRISVVVPPEAWTPVNAATGQIDDVAGLEALAAQFPDASSVRLRLLNALLGAERNGEALALAEGLVGRGYAFSPGALEFFGGLVVADTPPPWLALSRSNAAPIEASTLFAEVPASAQLVEGVLYDPAHDRLLVTTVVSRALYVREEGSEWGEVAIPGAGSLTGIALDEARGLLWIASGVFEPTPDPETAFRGLIALDRETLAVRLRLAAPEGVTVSDIAVGPDGSVFASDPLGGGIYWAAPGDTALGEYVAPGTFRSPQGLVVRPDGRSLVVSDYRYGLAVVVQRGRFAYRMETAQAALLDGIDGLWQHEGELIAVQSGLNPRRIVALRQDRVFTHLSGARVLEVAHPGWTEPVSGSVTGGALYYVANGQWDRFGKGGALVEGATAEPTQIRNLPLALPAAAERP